MLGNEHVGLHLLFAALGQKMLWKGLGPSKVLRILKAAAFRKGATSTKVCRRGWPPVLPVACTQLRVSDEAARASCMLCWSCGLPYAGWVVAAGA